MPAVLTAMGLLATTLVSQDQPPPVDPKLRARFGFLGPTIHKIGDGLSYLRVGHLRAGKSSDLLVNNSLRARLEIRSLTGKGDAEAGQAGIDKRSVSTTGEVKGLALADVNGDGLDDILLVNSRGRLITSLSGSNPAKVPQIEVGRSNTSDCLRSADVDGDEKADAVVLTTDGMQIVTGIAGNAKVHPVMPTFASRVLSFRVFDLDGDGHQDIIVCSNDDRLPLHVKLGEGKARFGPWILLDCEPLAMAFEGTGFGGRATIATIGRKPRRIVEYEMQRRQGVLRPALQVTALPNAAGQRPFVYGDIDGDGDKDLVVADPERARLTMFLEHKGHFHTVTAPSLAGISSLAIGDVNADGKPDLVMTSPEEKALAWRSGTQPATAFPVRLALANDKLKEKDQMPVTVAVDGRSILCLCRDKRRKAVLLRLTHGEQGFPEKPEVLADFKRMSRDPSRMLVADVGVRKGDEILWVVPSDGLKVLFQGNGGYEEATAQGGGAGFTKNMDDGALSVTETGQGRALMVVRERYARTFRFDKQGQPMILAQDNGPEGISAMAMGTTMPDGSRLYLDRKAGKLYRCTKGMPTVSTDLPAIVPGYLIPHGKSALVIGQRGILRVPFDKSFSLQPVRQHEPPTKKTNYFRGVAADLDGDGNRDLAMLDSHLHGVHVLVPGKNSLNRALSFPVFETTEGRGYYEPRQIATGDLNGDGRQDMVLIAHDRLLIYLQEE